MKYFIRVLSMGMVSSPVDFESREDAEKFAADMRRVPGVRPLPIEEVDE